MKGLNVKERSKRSQCMHKYFKIQKCFLGATVVSKGITVICNPFSRGNGTTDGSCKHWAWFFFTPGLSFTDVMLCKA